MSKRLITSTDYFNPDGIEILDEPLWLPEDAPISAKPTGFLDFNRSKYHWATELYDQMVNCFWTMGEVNTLSEKKSFSEMEENKQQLYKYTFGQLSYNDSIQFSYLADFSQYANNRMTKAVVIKQSETEILHSKGYSVLLDAVGNAEEVFDLYKTDEMLRRKNERIAELFASHINTSRTSEGMLLSAVCSVALEGIFFMVGFSFIYTIGDEVQGARDTIAFIHRDENAHMAMFANISKTLMRENGTNAKLIDKINTIMRTAVDIELEYGLYLLKRFPILGLQDKLLIDTINNFANQRMVALGLEKIFPKSPRTHLEVIVKKGLELNNVKSNFFEANVKQYSKQSLDMNF